MAEKTRQVNFRLTEDAIENFRAFCEEQGVTAAQGFDHMMQVVELDRTKQGVPERQTEISDFEMHTKAILGAYIQSVQLCEGAELRAAESFKAQLASKDQCIAEYQDQLRQSKEQIARLLGAERALEDAHAEIGSMQSELSAMADAQQIQLEQHTSQLRDKDNLIDILQKQLNDVQSKVTSYDELKTERDTLALEVSKTQAQMKELMREHERNLETALGSIRTDMSKQIATLKEQLQECKIESVNLLRNSESAAAAEIRQLEKEKADLREQLAKLNTQISQ